MDGRWRDAATTDLRVEPDHASLDGTESVDAVLARDASDATDPIGAMYDKVVDRDSAYETLQRQNGSADAAPVRHGAVRSMWF